MPLNTVSEAPRASAWLVAGADDGVLLLLLLVSPPREWCRRPPPPDRSRACAT
jgi:hypothetical protein